MLRDELATAAQARSRVGDAAGALALLEGAPIDDDAALLVLRAQCRQRVGQDALPDLLAAQRRSDDPSLLERGARVLLEANRPVEALAMLDHASSTASPAPVFACTRADVLRALGRSVEAFAVLEQACAANVDDTRAPTRLGRLALAAWSPDRAAPAMRRAVAHAPTDPALVDLCCEVLTAAGAHDAVDTLVATTENADPVRAARIVGWLVSLGRPDLALTVAQAALARGPSADLLAFLAHFHLIEHNLDAAFEAATHALSHNPLHGPAHIVLAAVAVRRDPATARPALDEAVRLSARSERGACLGHDVALCWRAEAHWRAGRHALAVQDARAALSRTSPYHLPAHLLMMLAATPFQDAAALPAGSDADRIAAARRCLPPAERIWSSWGHHAYEGCATLLATLDNDRTQWPTLRGEHGLVGFTWEPYPRHLTRGLQQRLRVEPPSAVLARFRALQLRHPEDPTLHTYEGETLLWLGQYEAAREAFERARQRFERTTWAWIGRGAAELMLGDPDRALATFAHGVNQSQSEGPSLFVYRGEAHLLRGDTARALHDLQQAVRRHPSRAAAWVLLASLELQQGDARRAEAVRTALTQTAPGLLQALDPGAPLDRWLLDLRLAMRGNRSSTVHTWMTADDALRFFVWKAPSATSPSSSSAP